MGNFNEQISRMKELYTYGQISESANKKGSIEHNAIAADNKAYAIIRECNKFYIKEADADKKDICEAYNYIGGYMNKKNYEYDSLNKALKQFDLKMMSLNEANDAKADTQSLKPEKRLETIFEGNEAMRKLLDRQRQIMENSCKIGCYEDPERVKGNNNPDEPFTNKAGEVKPEGDIKTTSNNPKAQSTPFGDKKKTEEYKTVKVNEDFDINGENDIDAGFEGTDDIIDTPEIEGENDFIGENDLAEFDGEDDFLGEFDGEDDFVGEFDGEDDFFSEDDFLGETDGEYDLEFENDMDSIDMDDTIDFNDDFEDDEFDMEECYLNEAKSKYMSSIVESVVKSLKEDNLNVWGKHPGYRKKPFTYPNPEVQDTPFGQTIGDSTPYDKKVEAITNSVLEQIKKKM